MSRLFFLMLAFCVSMLAVVTTVNATGEPSAGAKGMPGAKGTFEFKPEE